MTSVVSNNKDDTILANILATLQGVTVDGQAVFEQVTICHSREQAHETEFTDSPIAAIVCETTDVYLIAGLEEGCVIRADILVAVSGGTPTVRNRDLTRAINAARNVLNTSIPTLAHGFPDAGGDYHPRLMLGTPERENDPDDPWAMAWLPLEVAYRTTSDTTH